MIDGPRRQESANRIRRRRSPLAAVMEKHLEELRVQNYSEYTVKNRRVHLGFFVQWCHDRGITEPTEVTTAHSGALPATSVSLPEEERKAAELPQPARAPGAVARVVPVDGAAALHPAQPGVGDRTAAAGAPIAETRSHRRRGGTGACRSRTSTIRWDCATGRSWKRSTRPACGGWS